MFKKNLLVFFMLFLGIKVFFFKGVNIFDLFFNVLLLDFLVVLILFCLLSIVFIILLNIILFGNLFNLFG